MEQIIDGIFASKHLYHSMLKPVCDKYELTQSEVSILMYLADNPIANTSTDITEKLHMKKSIVSISLKDLQDRGLIHSSYAKENRRTLHSIIDSSATNVIEECRKIQNHYGEVMTDGFSQEEKDDFKKMIVKVHSNIKSFHQSEANKNEVKK